MTLVPPNLPPTFPDTLQPLATEIHTYFRALPQLLEGGHDGRFVLVKGNDLHGVWDTQWDAIQAGRYKFPDGLFLAQEVDYRLQEAFGGHFAPPAPVAQGAA